MTETVTYVYAVLHSVEGLETALSGVRGVAESPVRLVPEDPGGALAAAVSAVPSQDFREDALRRHLEDLDWLEAVARSHHHVIEILAAHTTVLPLRLATVYRNDERMTEKLQADADVFTHALKRLAGYLEWGVKIYVEAQPPEATGSPAATEELGPGRAYLQARRSQRLSRDESYHSAREAAERIEAIGTSMAAGYARHRVQQGELSVGSGENVVNDAYLLARETAADFRTRILDAVGDLPDVRIEVTGPWAPYSFADLPPAQPSAPEPAP
ncbi:GvpL/GvpF family gas vesicle protein [Streptomyces sp. NPDC001083]|uniref:GvpL/GvpF family gas vesicle protein n=1 Tax=Streptomyces sp. NPDC001083 TaxID=3364545 RepID=UPI00368F15D0